jgi:uncharacterized protein (UPF0548 family)
MDAKAWAEVPFSYPEIGAISRGERPPGYEHFEYRSLMSGIWLLSGFG